MIPAAVLSETAIFAPPVEDDQLFRVVDALDQVAGETGRTVPQIALNWLLDAAGAVLPP